MSGKPLWRKKMPGIYHGDREEMDGVTAEVIVPIICEGDPIGAVALLSRDPKAKPGEAELKLVSTRGRIFRTADGRIKEYGVSSDETKFIWRRSVVFSAKTYAILDCISQETEEK